MTHARGGAAAGGGAAGGGAPAPVLIEVTRAGLVESRLRGHLVLLDGQGTVAVRGGAPDEPVFARSTLKPLQAAAMVDAGLDERGPGLALAAASHAGEAQHVRGVRELLTRHGLTEEQLQCPPSWPSGADALVDWVRAGGTPARVCMNCSGKHAAMLATCRHAGWPTESYLAPEHPLQQLIRAQVEASAGEPVARTAVDGCGAPAFAVSLTGLARAFRGLAVAHDGPQAAVVRAMREYPELVSGTGREAAELTREIPGLVCKDGAEGVWAAALPDGRAFAAKFDDGGTRGRAPLLAAVLRHWGFAGPAVRRWSAVPTLGGGRPVGEIRPTAPLRDLLDLG